MNKTVGVIRNKVPQNWEILRHSRSPFSRLKYARIFKSNPRSADYMTSLFLEKFPGGQIATRSHKSISTDYSIILLYQDSIGVGWSRIDLKYLFSGNSRLYVLNGRGRLFPLTFSTFARLLLKRSFERSMIFELLTLFVATLVLPLLVFFDWTRGRT